MEIPLRCTQILTYVHFLAMGGLALYALHRLWLLAWWWVVHRSPAMAAPSFSSTDNPPSVTVQLPIYNERFVAARLLDAVAAINWSRSRMEIQVLDDSTDDTRKIVDERAAFWSDQGISMKVLRRERRDGFKAGALDRGMKEANGELIAIFDADFLPPPDFLVRTAPYFSSSKVGMVQTRWGFINQKYSWFTNIQSLLLGPHFGIEHMVRSKRGLFFNFNGTAGIWRREAIESSGGWQSDTVTEDLDLSYRAQLAGWRFVYLDGIIVPSELPTTLAAFRSQQQRWAKGSIQTAKKILPLLLTAPLPIRLKIEASAHLLANLGWLFGAIIALTLYPTIIWRVGIGPYELFRFDLPLFLGTSGAIFLYLYLHATVQTARIPILCFSLLPVFSIGLAPSIALAVLEGMICKGGVFKRTPKLGGEDRDNLSDSAFKYRQGTPLPYIIMNTALLIYSLMPIILSWQRGTWIAIPFLMLFPLGFSLVIFKDLGELKEGRGASKR